MPPFSDYSGSTVRKSYTCTKDAPNEWISTRATSRDRCSSLPEFPFRPSREKRSTPEEIHLDQPIGGVKIKNQVIHFFLLLVAVNLIGFSMKGIAKEKHWSLISPQKQSSAKNIDEFIEKKLAQKGLEAF